MEALSSNIYVNVAINLVLACIVFSVILALVFDNKKHPRPDFFGLMGWCVSLFGYVTAMAVSWAFLLDGASLATQQTLSILRMTYDACAYVFFGFYVSEIIAAKEPINRLLKYALCYSYLIIMPLGFVGSMLTTNTADTLYCDLLYFAVVAFAVIRHRGVMGLRALLLTCGLATTYALISLLPTWVFTPTAVADTVVLLFVYWLFWNERSRELDQQSNAQKLLELNALLDKTRAEAAVAQIQPHFLFNSLAAIRPLCDKDPALAQEAIGDFADYLRMNLESLSRVEPISFEDELDHTRIYLRFEQLRMGDRLHVAYEIERTDFQLPPLTVQPLVENAVRHGVFPGAEGGTVTVAARKVADGFEVEVRDDGDGFNVEELPHDGRAHVGLQNVRTRLATIGATLTVASGSSGTTARIFVPE